MTNETDTTKQIHAILVKRSGLNSYQVAMIIFKEIVKPLIEKEKSNYERLLFVNPNRSN
jgi:hypothetical protein